MSKPKSFYETRSLVTKSLCNSFGLGLPVAMWWDRTQAEAGYKEKAEEDKIQPLDPAVPAAPLEVSELGIWAELPSCAAQRPISFINAVTMFGGDTPQALC